MLATPQVGEQILNLIKVESITSIPICIQKIEFTETEQLSCEDKTLIMDDIILSQNDSVQGIDYSSMLDFLN